MTFRWWTIGLLAGYLIASGCKGTDDDDVADDDAADDDVADDDVADDDVADDETGDDDTGDDDSADDDTGDDDTVAMQGIEYAYMAVHLDPGNTPVDPVTGLPHANRPLAHLPDLTDLVVAADVGGHELTLMFTIQWAHHVLDLACTVPEDGDLDDEYEYQGTEYADCLSLIRAFEANGHEIAMHHHPQGVPAAWDGITDLESWTADRDFDGQDETYFADGGGPNGADPYYLGTTEFMMTFVDSIPTSGAATSGTTEEWPPGLTFSAAGGPEDYVDASNPGDLVSQPCAADHDGHWVWQVRMRTYTSTLIQDQVTASELPDALVDFAGHPDAPWLVGFVTHAINVDETGIGQYEALFAQLSAAGLTLQGLRDVMDHYAETAGDPSAADASLHCP